MSKYEDIKFSKNVSSYLSLFVIAALAVIFIVIAFFIYMYIKSGSEPLDPNSTEVKEVTIEQGSSAGMIGDQLEDEGIIRNGTMFEYFLKLNSITNYHAGDYELSPSMDFEQIAKTLETGRIYQEVLHRLTIPEGYAIEQIAEQADEQLPIVGDRFLELMQDEDFINTLIEEYPDMLSEDILSDDIKYPLEGYLYPATYDITEEEPDIEALVRQMLDATRSNSYSVFQSSNGYSINFEGESRDLSFHEFLTLSSLVEKEATSLADRSKIASVFLNRMSESPSMPLQTDPTVLYALGEHQERTLFEDLEVEDPYNTYINTGLPPGPIASPGMESIQSTMNPSNTNYYYFLADSEGNNHFAETFEEHVENREQYINNN
ncbi:endolytic transglycosylase MltG [Salinicoccus luteus]|uniref:endolytic transglycosylase MltG n=1 Tax=Salinicoccus luteus TaxID=367840 RepID=UPI0004E1CCA4|nr:endolytic transglycosylase MltG [Salinicoccus luteus]